MQIAIAPAAPRRRILSHLAALALAALLPFLALTAYLAVRIVTREVAESEELVRRTAQGTAEEMQRFIGRIGRILERLSARPEVAALDPARCDTLLADLVRLHPEFINAFTLRADGRVICTAKQPQVTPLRVDTTRYLDAARESKRLVVSRPFVGALSQRWIIVAALPLLDEGKEVTGVVGLSVDLVQLAESLGARSVAPDAVHAILDPGGRIVASHPEPQRWIGQEAGDTEVGRFAQAGGAVGVRGKGLTGIERIWAVSPVPGVGWNVLSGVPRESALEPAWRAAWWLLALAAAISLFVAATCIALGRPIARAVQSIAAAARRMASGAPLEAIPPSGPQEIAELSEDLNRLIERRAAIEENLRERERNLSLVHEHHPGLVARLDTELRYRYASPGYRRLLGRDPEQMIGKTVEEVHGGAHFEKAEAYMRRALAGERVDFEIDYPATAYGRVALQILLVPDVPEGGGVSGLFIFGTDLTEQRRATAALADERARLAGLVESAMDAIVSIDAEQRITLFNHAAEEMFRRERGQVVGQRIDILLPPEQRARHREHVREFSDSGVTRRRMGFIPMVRGRRADGDEFPIEATISQVEVEGVKTYTAILRDVTERKRTEEAITALNAELERRVLERTAELEAANQELQSFDYTISHDLRAPLNRIRGFSEALIQDHGASLAPAARKFLERIRDSGDAMDLLISDLLSLSVVTRGELQRTEVDLSRAARRAFEACAATEPGREVDWLVQPGLRAMADPGLVAVALENLVGNAWKYTGTRARARIEVGCREMDGETVYYVGDNGVGFDPAHAARLFAPFQRLPSGRQFAGTGIGLATVERVIRRHGGRIYAESTPDNGATFYFTLSPRPR